MKHFLLIVSILFSSILVAQKQTKIAFGSCGKTKSGLPILNLVVDHHPDLFIFLGDNVYGDTYDMEVLQNKYKKLNSLESYQNLKNTTPIIATWDDHDFGWNDAGRHYPFKEESKKIFLDFFEEPTDSDRWNHEGIYTSYIKEYDGKKLQIILLDNRTFRDDLKPYNNEFSDNEAFFYHIDYAPYSLNSDSTFLGEEQWLWLEKQFEKEADIRIIGSGSQFGISYNGYESWANFPNEQKRMIDLIQQKKVNGVVFLSGDVHYAEISKYESSNIYPIYDVTASGLSSKWHFATSNTNRIEGPVMENHFGLLTIDWKKEETSLKMEIWDELNNQRIEHTINLNKISF